MEQERDAPEPRLSGEAAWRAARDATERRNSEAKRRASAQVTASASAAIERERRLAAVERAQLQVLNERIVAHPGGWSAAQGDGPERAGL